jgi:hypothetical protein
MASEAVALQASQDLHPASLVGSSQEPKALEEQLLLPAVAAAADLLLLEMPFQSLA